MSEPSFEALARENLPALYSYCLALTCDREEAEELAAEALARACRGFAGLRDRAAFPAWLRSIARRCRWTWWRKRRRDPLAARANPPGDDPSEEIMDERETPEEHCERNQRAQRTLSALKKLPLKLREVVILRYFDELSYAEMAARLGVGVEAVDQRLIRAKRRLRTSLRTLEVEA